MRVCVVTIAGRMHSLGGMQDHTHDLAGRLAAGGHDVTVVSSRHPDGLIELEQDGVRWNFVDARGHQLDPGWHDASSAAFAALHAVEPFDVVHSESTSALGLVRRGVHRTVPVVAKFHGNYLSLLGATLSRVNASPALPSLLREAKGAVVLSCRDHFPRGNWYRFRPCHAIVPSQAELVNTCRSHLLDRRRVHVIPNGVDIDAFAPRSRAEARAETGLGAGPVFICVGRLNRSKGMEFAIRALAQLGARGADSRLVLVGDGPDRERLSALAAAANVADRVLFVGHRTPGEVSTYLAAADVFLFPTAHAEAAPLVLLQAMAVGLPVVASDIGPIAEVVDRPGDNGILVPRYDVRALAEAMAALAAAPDRRFRLGAAARERILGAYSLDRMTELTLGVYSRAVAEHAEQRLVGAR